MVCHLYAHYSPAPSEIVQQFKFHSWFQNPGESVATYVFEIRSLSQIKVFAFVVISSKQSTLSLNLTSTPSQK